MYVIVEIGKFGPQTFPQFIAIGMMLLSIAQIIATIQQIKSETLENKAPEVIQFELSNELRVLIVMLISTAYCVVFDAIGFLISTLVYATAMMFYFEVRKWRLYLVFYVAIFLLYILFAKLMHVPL
jgi:hypothetical protein